MIRRLFKILFLILIISASNAAQSGIEIYGNKNFDKDNYRQWIGNVNNVVSSAVRDTIINRISQGLTRNGFFHFSIDSLAISGSLKKKKIKIYLHENEPTVIGSLKFKGVKGSDSTEVAKILEDLRGNIFTAGLINGAIDELLDYFENRGFPFAGVKIESVIWNEGELPSVNIVLNISKNRISRIDLVEINGNVNTADEVIIRELRLKEGEKYSRKLIESIPEKLNRLKFFQPVEEPVYYLNRDNKGVLRITVKEKETNNFDGIIGYVPPREDNEKGYVTGYVNVSLRNLFGTGRAFAFRWQNDDRFSQEFELKYLEPWAFGFPFNVSFSLFQRKQDTTYVKRNLNLFVEFLATEKISASFLVGTGETIATENLKRTPSVFNASLLDLGFQLKIDTRDDPLSPRSGLLFFNSYKFTQKNISGPPVLITPEINTKSNLQNIQLDFGYYYEIFGRQVIALNVHGRELRGDNLDDGDLFLFGGTNSVRGYREKQFTANRLFWSKAEYRYLMTRRSYAFLFYDFGYYLKNENRVARSPKAEQNIYGYGFGVSLETELGILAVSYAIAKGGSLTNGLIHFGIISDF